MKKNFSFYALVWTLLLAVWCAVVFLVRPVVPGYVVRYDTRFWAAFVLIAAAFAGNLLCAYFAFRVENLSKLFLKLPLVTVSWRGLLAMLAAGAGIMLIPDCPAWIAAAACIVILVFNAIAVIQAAWAADMVGEIDEKVKGRTAFLKNLTIETEHLLARAKGEGIQAACKRVHEAVRYSDPVSHEALFGLEAQITGKTEELSAAVGADDGEKARELAEEIVLLVGERNLRCKASK